MSRKPKKKLTAVQANPQKARTAVKQNIPLNIPAWAPLAIIVFTALLYSKALFNGLTGLDDDFYITNNPAIRDFSFNGVKTICTSFYAGNYHPLTMLIYLFEYKFFALNPLPYHLLNIALHLLNSWLVYLLAERLSGRKVTALIVSLLFAVHPMHVESVAWVSELKDVSYALFYLLSMLVYLRYLSSGHRLKDYFGVLLLFTASLLCKSAAVTLPVLLIAIDVYKGRKIDARSLTEKIPMLLMSVVFGILAIISQRQGGAYNGLMISYGAVNSFFLFTSGIAFYFLWLIAPVSLSIFHYFPDLNNGLLPWPYYASLPVVLFIAWMVARRNSNRKEILFGVSFFLITISVMLQVISVGSALTAERYTYMSYIGLFYIIGQLISSAIEKKQHKNTIIGIFSLFIVIFSAVTWNRIDVWKNDNTLFNDLIDKNPNFYYGYWLRGNLEKKESNPQEALADYTKCIELNPKYEDAYYNRGIINNELGRVKDAIGDYTQSIKLNSKQADAYNSRGWAYYESGNVKAAIEDFNQAIALKPDYAEAYNNRGWAYDQSGDVKSAIADFNQAIKTDPGFDKPVYNRAALKAKTGDLKGAIEDYNLLLKLHPDDNVSYFFRGKAYLGLNDINSACADWQKASEFGNKSAAGLIKEYCK